MQEHEREHARLAAINEIIKTIGFSLELLLNGNKILYLLVRYRERGDDIVLAYLLCSGFDHHDRFLGPGYD